MQSFCAWARGALTSFIIDSMSVFWHSAALHEQSGTSCPVRLQQVSQFYASEPTEQMPYDSLITPINFLITLK